MAGEIRRRLLGAFASVRRIPPAAVLIVTAVFAIAYGYPGYMNFDAAEQLKQARAGAYDDWHPPLMARYWHYLDQVIHGPFTLLVLQITFFLIGGYGLLRRRFQPLAAAFMTAAVLLWPPVLAVMGPVWKDAQMVGFLLCGFMLLMRESWLARAGGLVVLFFAAGVRDNACVGLPPFLLLAVASWGYRRKLVICGLAFALFVLITGSARYANVKLADGRSNLWTKSNAIHDIAGTLCYADPLSDEEIKQELVGIPLRLDTGLQQRFCQQYDPRWWFGLSYAGPGPFVTQPDPADRDARTAAYFRVIRNHPSAFLYHRWRVSKELLGLGVAVPDEPVCQTFVGADYQAKELKVSDSRSFLQRVFGRKFVRYSQTLLFRPWAYMLVGVVLLVYAIRRRNGLVIAFITSGFMLEGSFFVAAAGAPFRYSHYMVMCVCFATVIVFGERLREGWMQRGSRRQS